ncbi:MAG: hypothetical protein ACLUNO_09565 [Oscillospiraceae bacterium]
MTVGALRGAIERRNAQQTRRAAEADRRALVARGGRADGAVPGL